MNNAAERIYERLLVVRCQTRDAAAMTELIERYARRLRFYLRKMCGDALVDDLLQEVWMEALASIARLKNPDAFGAWIYRIARHRAFAEHRPTRLEMHADIDVLAPEDDDDWSAEDAEAVRVGLDALPVEQREVLVLRFIEDMTYEEIASVVNCPVGTIRSRIHYAKATLRKFLEQTSSRKERCHERESTGQGDARR